MRLSTCAHAVCLLNAVLGLLLQYSIYNGEVRRVSFRQTAAHYCVWFSALEKNIVVEINFQGGTQTLKSAQLEVISCWFHKMRSTDSRPCGSRQIAWLMAMCWKKMPALCIFVKMDIHTANSGLFGRGSFAHSKQGDQWNMWPQLDLTWQPLLSSLADVDRKDVDVRETGLENLWRGMNNFQTTTVRV